MIGGYPFDIPGLVKFFQALMFECFDHGHIVARRASHVNIIMTGVLSPKLRNSPFSANAEGYSKSNLAEFARYSHTAFRFSVR